MASVTIAPSTHQLHVDGHTLVGCALNPGAVGQPTVLLHGITASVSAWGSAQAGPWLERGPCYSLSLPGHFPARFPPGLTHRELSAELIAETMAAALLQLVGDTPVTLVGHSTGGFTALAVAARAPRQVARVISIGGFARGQWTGALGWNQRMVRSGPLGRLYFHSLYALCRQHYSLYKAVLRIYVHDIRRLYAYPNFDTYLGASLPNYRGLDLRSMEHYFRAMPEIDISAWLPRIQAPVLLVAGAEDPIVPATESTRSAQLIARASVHLLPACGHIPFLEQPAALEAVVRRWLAATEPMLPSLVEAL